LRRNQPAGKHQHLLGFRPGVLIALLSPSLLRAVEGFVPPDVAAGGAGCGDGDAGLDGDDGQ